MRFLVFAMLLTGCAHVANEPSTRPAAGPWFSDAETLIAFASTARDLPVRAGWTVEPLSDADFELRQQALSHEEHVRFSQAVHSGAAAFSRIEPGEDPEASPPVVDAFFDPVSRAIVVRQAIVAAGRADLFRAIGALLQNELIVADPIDPDAVVARHFLLRGDRELTRVLLETESSHAMLERALELARAAEGERLQQRPKSVEVSWLHAHWTSLAARFMIDLYVTGGAPLARRALEHPPAQSATLRSAQVFIDGAPGLESLTDPPRRLGLYGFERFLLTPNGDRDPALIIFPELHYADDQHRLSGRTLSWVVDWSDLEDRGEQIASELGTLALLLAGYQRGDIEAEFFSGRLALISGAPSADRERLARSVVRTPRRREAPEADAKVPPLRPQLMWRQPGEAKWAAPIWSQADLGLTMNVPDATPQTPGDGIYLLDVPGGRLSLAFIDHPPDAELRDLIIARTAKALTQDWKIEPPREGATGTWNASSFATLPAQEVFEEWPGPTAVHALVVPVCDGNASLVILAAAARPSAQTSLDAAIKSARLTGPMSICQVSVDGKAGTASQR